MNHSDILDVLGGNQSAATYIVDNFESVQLVGFGTFSIVFKATSKQFHPKQQVFAVKVILSSDNLKEYEIKRIYEAETFNQRLRSVT